MGGGIVGIEAHPPPPTPTGTRWRIGSFAKPPLHFRGDKG